MLSIISGWRASTDAKREIPIRWLPPDWRAKRRAEFERAVQLDPANVPARVDLAQYYTEAPAIMGGGLDKAREQAEQVAKYDAAKAHLILASGCRERETIRARPRASSGRRVNEREESGRHVAAIGRFLPSAGPLGRHAEGGAERDGAAGQAGRIVFRCGQRAVPGQPRFSWGRAVFAEILVFG